MNTESILYNVSDPILQKLYILPEIKFIIRLIEI